MTRQELETRLIKFAAGVYKINRQLSEKREGNLGDQVFRASSSAALNYGEVQGAASKKDFIHKNRIVLKELRETMIALKLIKEINIINTHMLDNELKENNELIAIFVSAIKTAELRR